MEKFENSQIGNFYMHNNDKIIASLNSTFSKLFILGTAFMAQVPHTVAVFTEGRTCEAWSCLASYQHLPAVAAGVSLEGGILFVLLRGWHKGSYAFAGVSVLVNVAYYAMGHGGDAFSLSWIELLKSVIVPAVIAVYSHLLADAPAPVTRRSSAWMRCKTWASTQWAHIAALGKRTSDTVNTASDAMEQPLQDAADAVIDELSAIIAGLQGDARSKYLHLRKLGKWGNAELCRALQVNASTGNSWWNRAQAQGAGD